MLGTGHSRTHSHPHTTTAVLSSHIVCVRMDVGTCPHWRRTRSVVDPAIVHWRRMYNGVAETRQSRDYYAGGTLPMRGVDGHRLRLCVRNAAIVHWRARRVSLPTSHMGHGPMCGAHAHRRAWCSCTYGHRLQHGVCVCAWPPLYIGVRMRQRRRSRAIVYIWHRMCTLAWCTWTSAATHADGACPDASTNAHVYNGVEQTAPVARTISQRTLPMCGLHEQTRGAWVHGHMRAWCTDMHAWCLDMRAWCAWTCTRGAWICARGVHGHARVVCLDMRAWCLDTGVARRDARWCAGSSDVARSGSASDIELQMIARRHQMSINRVSKMISRGPTWCNHFAYSISY
jgi:hypothetical protein